ncbi:MAG TPA: GGDEF domain-containing protein [Acidobacteriaceae bacterium]
MIDWHTLPDLGAVALLTCAFGSVARRGHTSVSRLWLTGWLMIVLHFFADMFTSAPGAVGALATIVTLNTLVWAGLLFMWACVPYRKRPSSRWMMASLLFANTLYVTLNATIPHPRWELLVSAALFAVLPLAVTLSTLRSFNHPLRWSLVLPNTALALFLFLFQSRTPNGSDLALNAVIFTVYFGCCIHFWYAWRRATAGPLVTIAGFLAWALVFVIAPLTEAYWPNLHIENEVWNLPKYVVAVGMILLLLEEQIEHNKYLALHDELTGLPNRRLFQDRISTALQRARRNQSRAALLLIDLDQFKQVNDTVGHHVGDQLLQHVADIFRTRVRRSDTVARTGGDEFAVILEEPVSRRDAEQVSVALIEYLKQPIQINQHTVTIGASVGIAIFPDDAATAESLRIAADRNMYADKNASRGREAGHAPASFLHSSQPANN